MRKSFIDRIFPPPQDSFLSRPRTPKSRTSSNSRNEDSSSDLVPRLELLSPSSLSSASSKTNNLGSVPLSASIIHHADPFLPVERAARALERTIQSLLDSQAEALKDRTSGVDADETSLGSRTPTPSLVSPATNTTGSGAVPVRQPRKQKVSLRSARQRLGRSMQEFAKLREEELRVIDQELGCRRAAIEQARGFAGRKEAIESRIQSIQDASSSSTSHALRSEAENVGKEIYELETKLLELKVRQRHLLDQATQLENAAESELSSFKGTLAQINREEVRFLTKPPISHELSSTRSSETITNMYVLRPERRTVEMAEEQWNGESRILDDRRQNIQEERNALLNGEKVWQESVTRITSFEKLLRKQLAALTDSVSRREGTKTRTENSLILDHGIDTVESTEVVLKEELMATISFLRDQLSHAEANNWNLLVCALGAELEAFRQAQELLGVSEEVFVRTKSEESESSHLRQTQSHENTDDDEPSSDLLTHVDGDHNTDSPDWNNKLEIERRVSNNSQNSNESLKTTLKELGVSENGTTVQNKANGNVGRAYRPQRTATMRSESEDDDPGPDFLVSH